MIDQSIFEKEAIECEKSVIGIMMLEPEESKRVFDTLTAKMFYSVELGTIFNCCKKLKEKGLRADPATVIDKLGAEYQKTVLMCAETVPSISGLDSYINGVMDSWRSRTMRQKMMELCENGMDADAMTAELQTVLQQQERIIDHQKEATNKPYKECILEFMEWMQKPDTSIKTGWAVIDNSTGGLQRGCITVIAARPGCGKTTLGLQMACNIAKSYKVLYISLEMTTVQLTRNIVSRTSRVNSQKISNRDLTQEEHNKIAESIDFLYDKMQLCINDTPGMTVADVENAIKATKPDVVVIDHIRLLTPMVKKNNEFEASAENTHALKQIAKNHNINIIELVQAKRESEGRVPGMADLYGGAATEQDADMIIGICPESGFQSMEQCTVTIEVTKNRHGAGGSWEFVWNRPTCGIYYMENR